MKDKRQRWYTPSEERAWRSTFTRENRLGEQKLAHDLRTMGPARLVQAQKKASEERGLLLKAKHAEDYYQQIKQVMPGGPQVSLAEPVRCARVGLKERVVYRDTEKIVETYDGLGNLVNVEAIAI